MESLSDRHAATLLAAVQQYIETAQPVSSRQLQAIGRSELSAASIRSVLHELTEAGYLYQPHTSAGRVPTDVGYRYYVDHVRRLQVLQAERRRIERQFAELVDEYEEVARSSAKLLARLSGSLAVGAIEQPRDVHEAGLGEFMRQPEGSRVETVRELSAVIDQVDAFLRNVVIQPASSSAVYIGREIPFMQDAEYTSIVVQSIEDPRRGRIHLVLVGPKRMPYSRNIALLDTVATIISEQTA